MFYRCDPNKAKECEKRTCYLNGGNCGLTTNINWASNPNRELKAEECVSPRHTELNKGK